MRTFCLWLSTSSKWKHLPRYWPFVRGTHRWPVNSPHKCHWRGALMLSFYLRLKKRSSKQSWGWWFETPSRPLWRHCNEILQSYSSPSVWFITFENWDYCKSLGNSSQTQISPAHNSTPTGQNGHHFADEGFKCIFKNKKIVFWFEFQLSLFLRVQ